MYHDILLQKNIAPAGDIFLSFLLVAVLALLIRDAAARLASRLARGLALAAAALLRALAQIAGLDGLDMLRLHVFLLCHIRYLCNYCIQFIGFREKCQ